MANTILIFYKKTPKPSLNHHYSTLQLNYVKFVPLMASTLMLKFLSLFIWEILSSYKCFQACMSVLSLHSSQVATFLLQSKGFYWFGSRVFHLELSYWVLWWLHKGFVSIFIINIHLCLHSIVSPFLLSFWTIKLNEWCKFGLIIMICKFGWSLC